MDEAEGMGAARRGSLHKFTLSNTEPQDGVDYNRFQCLGPARHLMTAERNPGVCPECDADMGIAPSSLAGA